VKISSISAKIAAIYFPLLGIVMDASNLFHNTSTIRDSIDFNANLFTEEDGNKVKKISD